MNKEKVVAIAAVSLVAYTLALGLFNSASSPLQTNSRISSGGAVKAIGVMIYSDASATTRLTSIDWGILEPDESKSVTLYIRNEGNYAVTLSLLTENWNPSIASQHMTLSWNREGQSVNPSEIVDATLTLAVSPGVSGITDFYFDVVIIGSG